MLQLYINRELPYIQAGFRKGRGTKGQVANICWITEKRREIQKNINFSFIDYAKTFDYMDHNKLENSSRDGNTRPPYLPPEKSVSRSRSNSQKWTWKKGLVPNWKRSTSRLYVATLLIYLIFEYIMQNAGLDEAQAGIKIARRNINNLRYAYDTTLWQKAKRKQSLLMKMKV